MTTSSGLLLKYSQWLKLGQTEARSWEFNVTLLHGRQGLNCLNHQHLLSPQDALKQEVEPGSGVWNPCQRGMWASQMVSSLLCQIPLLRLWGF